MVVDTFVFHLPQTTGRTNEMIVVLWGSPNLCRFCYSLVNFLTIGLPTSYGSAPGVGGGVCAGWLFNNGDFKHGVFPHGGGVAYGAKVLYRNLAGKSIAARVQSRQETVNKRFKNWAILSCTMYCYKFLEHQTVFGAIVVIVWFLLQ